MRKLTGRRLWLPSWTLTTLRQNPAVGLLPPLVSGGSTGRRYEKRQCGIAGRMLQCVCRVRVVQRCELTRSHDSCQTRPRLGACEIYYVRSVEDFADMQHRNCMWTVCRISITCSEQTNTPHTHWDVQREEREPRLGPERLVPCRLARMCLPTGHGDPVNDVTLEPLHPAVLQKALRHPPSSSFCLTLLGPFGLDPSF